MSSLGMTYSGSADDVDFSMTTMQKLFEIQSEGSLFLPWIEHAGLCSVAQFFQIHFQGGGVVLFGSCGSCEMTSCETICVWRFSCCDLFQDSAKSFLSNLEFFYRS